MAVKITTTADILLYHIVWLHSSVKGAIRDRVKATLRPGVRPLENWTASTILQKGVVTYGVSFHHTAYPIKNTICVFFDEKQWAYSNSLLNDSMWSEDLIALCKELSDEDKCVILDWVLNPPEKSCVRADFRMSSFLIQSPDDAHDMVVIKAKTDGAYYEIQYPAGENHLSVQSIPNPTYHTKAGFHASEEGLPDFAELDKRGNYVFDPRILSPLECEPLAKQMDRFGGGIAFFGDPDPKATILNVTESVIRENHETYTDPDTGETVCVEDVIRLRTPNRAT